MSTGNNFCLCVVIGVDNALGTPLVGSHSNDFIDHSSVVWICLVAMVGNYLLEEAVDQILVVNRDLFTLLAVGLVNGRVSIKTS